MAEISRQERNKVTERPCPACWGYDPKCPMCPRLKEIAKNAEQAKKDKKAKKKLRDRFLAEIWIKARKYLIITLTPAPAFCAEYNLNPLAANKLLDEVEAAFGPWMGHDKSRMPIPPDVEKLLKSPF